jgi:hypothetical protein
MQRALFAGLIQAGKYFNQVRSGGCSVDRAVKSGVVRWDGSSLAAIRFEQYFNQYVIGHENVETAVQLHFDGLKEDEDAALKMLRYVNQLSGELEQLRDTGGFDELKRNDPSPLFSVGDILEHQTHGLVVVYGWEPECKAQSYADPTVNTSQLLVDNRLFFASIERDEASGTVMFDEEQDGPYYRVVTKAGIAHYCHEQLLGRRDPLPSKTSFEPVTGTTFFFEGSDGTRYLPNLHLLRRYPHDVPPSVAKAAANAAAKAARRRPARSPRRG